jgi:hypothetical protein
MENTQEWLTGVLLWWEADLISGGCQVISPEEDITKALQLVASVAAPALQGTVSLCSVNG